MLVDYHCHSNYSDDAHDSIGDKVRAAILFGLDELAITDHFDPECENPVPDFHFRKYHEDIDRIQRQLKERTELLSSGKTFGLSDALDSSNPFLFGDKPFVLRRGLEIGVQPTDSVIRTCKDEATKYSYDFLLCSEHCTAGRDNWLPPLYENITAVEAYLLYFTELLEIVTRFKDYDSAAHLTLFDRYSPERAPEDTWFDYADEILKVIVRDGKALELNVSTWVRGNDFTLPTERVLLRFKELGGEYITLGGDSHAFRFVGHGIREGMDYLRSLGFRYFTTYEQHKPIQNPL